MADPPVPRPAPTANGTLAKTPLLHLILYALDKRLTGTIEVLSPDKRSAAILFAEGRPAKARTSDPVAHLGRVLREMGLVNEEQLTRSLADLAREKAAGKRLHGQLLVASGAIDEAKLQAGLVEQMSRKLRHVAAMPPETAYAYYDGFDALRGWGGEDDAGCDPLPFLRAMLRESPPVEQMRKALDHVTASPLRIARNAEVARLRLSSEESYAVDLLRLRPMKASEIAKAARLEEAAAEQLAYLLLATKQVDVLKPSSSSPPSSRRTSRTPPPASPSGTPPAAASSPPGGTTASRPPSIRVGSPPADLSPALAERWMEIASRAATIDRADYFMMLELSRDATADNVESAFLGLAKRWHPDRLPADLAPVRDACSRVFARMSEAHTTLADGERRARYMKLLAEGSGSPAMQESVAKVLEAARDFQKAEICFKRNDVAQAETFCRQAVEADATQPDYQALLAWLLALKPENQTPEKTMQSIKMLDRALSLSNRCEKAFYWRGMLYKRVNKPELAAKDFRRAYDLNSRNIDAAREVRLHNMRGGRRSSPPPAARASSTPPKAEEAPKGGGIFGRLFKTP